MNGAVPPLPPYAFMTCTMKTLTFTLNHLFLISDFPCVMNVICFLLGNSPASEFYMLTFQNTLSVPSQRRIGF